MRQFANSFSSSCFQQSILKFFVCSFLTHQITLLFSNLSDNSRGSGNSQGQAVKTSICTNWEAMETSIGTNDWGMVDDMGGAVGGDMLLDRDLGNMVDLVVDLISNLVDNRGSGNSKRGSMSNSNWGSMSNSQRSSMSNSKRSSMSNSKRSSMGNSKRSCSNSRSGSINTSCQTMSEKTMSKETMSIDTTSKDLSISISSGGSKATGNKGRQNNKRLHVDSAESIRTIPMYSALI